MASIAILIPTYNRPEHLRRAVEQLCPLLSPETRLILVDDASTDPKQRRYLEDIAEQRDYVTVIRLHCRHGCTRARKVILDHLSEEFVVILDDDAYFAAPTAKILETILERFIQEPRLGAQAFHIVEQKKASLSRTNMPRLDGQLVRSFTNCGCTLRTAAYRDAGGYRSEFDSPYGEEMDLALRMLAKGWLIRAYETPLVFHDVTHVARSDRQNARGRTLNYLRFAWWYHPIWFALPYSVWLIQKRVREGLQDPTVLEGVFLGVKDFLREWPAIITDNRGVTRETLKIFYSLNNHALLNAKDLKHLSEKRWKEIINEYL